MPSYGIGTAEESSSGKLCYMSALGRSTHDHEKSLTPTYSPGESNSLPLASNFEDIRRCRIRFFKSTQVQKSKIPLKFGRV